MGERGRPQLPPEEARSRLIGVRVTPEEHELIRRLAEGKGLSVSDWAREILVTIARRQAKTLSSGDSDAGPRPGPADREA